MLKIHSNLYSTLRLPRNAIFRGSDRKRIRNRVFGIRKLFFPSPHRHFNLNQRRSDYNRKIKNQTKEQVVLQLSSFEQKILFLKLKPYRATRYKIKKIVVFVKKARFCFFNSG